MSFFTPDHKLLPYVLISFIIAVKSKSGIAQKQYTINPMLFQALVYSFLQGKPLELPNWLIIWEGRKQVKALKEKIPDTYYLFLIFFCIIDILDFF